MRKKKRYLRLDVTALTADNEAELKRIAEEYIALHALKVAPADEPSPTCKDC